MNETYRQEPEYTFLESHEENGIIIVDKIQFSGIGLVEEVNFNDTRDKRQPS